MYIYVVLPLGILSAPCHFSKILVLILSYLHSLGIVVLTYIDDGFNVVPSLDERFKNVCMILHTFRIFGSSS